MHITGMLMLRKRSQMFGKLILPIILFPIWQNEVYAQSFPVVEDSDTQPSYKVVNPNTYKKIRDIIFPINIAGLSDSRFCIVLDFEASSEHDERIIIARTVDGAKIVSYKLAQKGLFKQINAVLTGTLKEDLILLAKKIEIKKAVFIISEKKMQKWYNKLSRVINKTIKKLRKTSKHADTLVGSAFLFHGTHYSVHYKDLNGEMKLSLDDFEINDPKSRGEFPLVRWMNSVRLEVAKLREEVTTKEE